LYIQITRELPASLQCAAPEVLSCRPMKSPTSKKLRDGAKCKVVGGTHAGKAGVVKDINTSKTGHVTITVLQVNGTRFKTLAKNIELI